ncbi:uncharacterized protein [Aquarana catesbeiana]|uniref:uncharacterized protein n=1 Tax=Aquarana catesbeiana TaxID=8400 RepID=UPI003CC9F00D
MTPDRKSHTSVTRKMTPDRKSYASVTRKILPDRKSHTSVTRKMTPDRKSYAPVTGNDAGPEVTHFSHQENYARQEVTCCGHKENDTGPEVTCFSVKCITFYVPVIFVIPEEYLVYVSCNTWSQQHFRKGIYVNRTTGCCIIENVQKSDSGFYELFAAKESGAQVNVLHKECRVIVLLLASFGHAIFPDVEKDPCVNLIFCTLRSQNNYCEFYRGSDFVLEVDRNRWNVADELKNRSIVHKYGDYGCATIRNLRESDAGYYTLHISKEDGIRHLRQTFSLSESVLKCLLNVSHFDVNTSRIDVGLPIYRRKNDTELPEALQLTAVNGKIPGDYSLAFVVTAQDVASEKSMDVTTPTGAPPSSGNAETGTIIIILVMAVVVIYICAITIYYCIRDLKSINSLDL